MIFLIGSALCGLSQSMIELITFRVLRGTGAGPGGPGQALEGGRAVPSWPDAFVRGADSVLGPYADLVRPALTERFDYEAEPGGRASPLPPAARPAYHRVTWQVRVAKRVRRRWPRGRWPGR